MTNATAVPITELTADRLYTASRTPELVRVPAQRVLMMDGDGDPNSSARYRAAIEALYGLSYKLKFAIKKENGCRSASAHLRVSGGQTTWPTSPLRERPIGVGR
jgi:hypothetical protein